MNPTTVELVAGGFVVFVAAFLGGITGFGFSLVATPLLLVLSFALPYVVAVNLSLAVISRLGVAYRFREKEVSRRAIVLVAGSIPGLLLGAVVLRTINESVLKTCLGATLIVASILLVRSINESTQRSRQGETAVAGFFGGFLGTTTSLNGIAPVLLLVRDRAAPTQVIADLAVYFVASGAIGLALLGATGTLDTDVFYPTFVAWLPGALAGNLAGAHFGSRLPEPIFRRISLSIVLVAGIGTVASGLRGV